MSSVAGAGGDRRPTCQALSPRPDRSRRRLAAWSVAVMLLLGACDGDGTDAGSTELASTSTSAPSSTPTTPPTQPPASPITTQPAPTTAASPPATESSTVPPAAPSTQPASMGAPQPTAAVSCPARAPGVHEITLTAGGADHPVRIFVPTSYGAQPLAAVLDWHGLGSNGQQQAMYSGYDELAEREGFVAVHPTGVSEAVGGPNSWQLVATPGGRDDLAFAHALIDELVGQWCVDARRVYSTGMSNGGFFTARLVCEMADRIAAAVSVAGTYHPERCDPARPVPYLAYHGTDDAVVPYDGDGQSTLVTPDSPDAWRVFFTQVIPDEFAEFAGDAGCDVPAVAAPVGDDVIRHEYAACDGSTPMALFEIVGGGHTWPGSPMAELVRGALGHTTDTVDATDDGWAFMSQFSL